MKVKKRAVVNIKECVACGACVKECPVGAITINKGMHALVDYSKCIGCGKCARICPASVIEIERSEG